MIDVIPRPRQEVPILLSVTDNDLRFSKMDTNLTIEEVIRVSGDSWSDLLTHRVEGMTIVLEPKTLDGFSIDRRSKVDRFVEIVNIACVIKFICYRDNIVIGNVDYSVSDDLLPYVPYRSKLVDNYLWTVHKSTKNLISRLLDGILTEVVMFPRIDLPYGIESYAIDSQLLEGLLSMFTFREETSQRFIMRTRYTGEIVNGNLTAIQDDLTKSGLRDRVSVEIHDEIIFVKGWIGDVPTESSYENVILFYIWMKSFYPNNLSLEIYNNLSTGVKIVKNNLWASPAIIHALITSGLLSKENIKESSAIKIGLYGLYKYPLNNSGIVEISKVFGQSIFQSEFIVRSSGKVEIISSDKNTLDLVFDIIDQNSTLYRINQRSMTNIVIEAMSPAQRYLDIMKLYFTAKSIRGLTLVSELDPNNRTLGSDALRDISNSTEFGGGSYPPHIMTVTNPDGSYSNYLVGGQDAIASILSVLPETIRRSIRLQEIQPGVLGRHLNNRAYVYISFLLN